MSANETSFFNFSSITESAVRRMADTIFSQNATAHFIDRLVREDGIPVWTKSELITLPGQPGITSIMVPLVPANTKAVNTFLYCRMDKDRLDFQLIKGNRYGSYGFNNRQDVLNAGRIAQLLMYFDYKLYGDTLFSVNDARLLHPSADSDSKALTLPSSTIITIRPSLKAPERPVCASGVQIYYTDAISSNPDPFHLDPCTIWVWTGQQPITIGGITYTPGGTSTSPNGTGGPDSNTGSPSWWIQDPCLLWDGKEYLLDAPGCTTTPPIQVVANNPLSNEPLLFLTTRERQVWDNIYQEEADANAVFNKDCQGTNRTGNIQWPGVLEHWMIMLDYISQNPVYGEVEYQIPGSSAAGNRGYADLVNTFSREMFEIKSKVSSTAISDGVAELQRYLDQANAVCPPKPGDGGLLIPWNAGKTYTTRILPDPRNPLMNIKAELAKDGIILYSSTFRAIEPILIVIPSDVFDKIKNLVKKLKDNFKDFEAIIARFLDENPDLKSYLKTTAYTAAAGIIVGTIIEDFLTAGAGVADDWTSFLVAKRIVEFASKL
jgi:hypothetical protein